MLIPTQQKSDYPHASTLTPSLKLDHFSHSQEIGGYNPFLGRNKLITVCACNARRLVVPLKKGIIKLLYLEIERRDQIYVKCFHFHFDVAYGKPLMWSAPSFF